ncbi:disease resistance family protein / LRR family protein [Striga hermonthica]|uniref:Disease resistance family protein / LRR family protein n=1 Tax=Striga hermonthica TaxID=68872 RepID=A0A9N7N4W6_STRHE|nr:disease resistance family protein / LRR family protein [Striga hermonthica]
MDEYFTYNLKGTFSLSLFELTHLNYVELSYIDFSGSPIPESICSLERLRHLSLSHSNFVGSIPLHFKNLSMLRHLDLSGNNGLTITNLEWLSGFRSLEYIDLSYVSLEKVKTWLQAITNLENLKEVRLSGCDLSNDVVVPSSSLDFVNATSDSLLVLLDLSHNNIVSFMLILREFRDVSKSLSYLDLSFNSDREKVIPDEFGSFVSLSYLNLQYCNLTGSISYALFGSLTRLSYLDLSFNNLEGNIPNALWSLISIGHLDLSYNKLQGEFSRPSEGNPKNVRYLDLSHNNLSGKISHLVMWLWESTVLEYLCLDENLFTGSLPNMSRFSSLKEIRLKGNQLNGSLGHDSFNLPSLEVLDVSENKFFGPIPNLSSCLSLRLVSLDGNMFNGTLPETIGYLSSAEELNLSHNNLEGVIIEAHFLNLSKLTTLNLSFNSNLTIRISSSWNPVFQLSSLTLASCKVGPLFPRWLRNQKRVKKLDISNSGISDYIPAWFWNNTVQSDSINLSYNHIYGVLPDFSFTPLALNVDLSSNELTGSLPPLGNSELFSINLSRNKFSGTLHNICNNLSTLSLDLSNNFFSGEIPRDCFGNFLNAEMLNLANNNFSGEIPNSIDSDCNVISLHLRNNSFTGEIPSSLMNCTGLVFLDLGENKFTGQIPVWLGDSLLHLSVLILKSNELYGALPSSLCRLSNLQVLDLSVNKISGTLPECVNNFTVMASKDFWFDDPDYFLDDRIVSYYLIFENAYVTWKRKSVEYKTIELSLLKTIDLSSNNITGEIPNEITCLVGLFGLNLSGNNLVGPIPDAIGRLDLLNFLDLSRNELSAHIPLSLSQLSFLGILDLSFNNLFGKIPWVGHMQTFKEVTYNGNPLLCGPPLVQKPCPEDEMTRNGTDSGQEREDDMFFSREFWRGSLLGFVIAFWGVFGSLFLSRQWYIAMFKKFAAVEDWLYVKILVNERRLQRFFS